MRLLLPLANLSSVLVGRPILAMFLFLSQEQEWDTTMLLMGNHEIALSCLRVFPPNDCALDLLAGLLLGKA